MGVSEQERVSESLNLSCIVEVFPNKKMFCFCLWAEYVGI